MVSGVKGSGKRKVIGWLQRGWLSGNTFFVGGPDLGPPPDGGDGDGEIGDAMVDLVHDIFDFLGLPPPPEDVIRTLIDIDGWGVRIAAISVGIGTVLASLLQMGCEGRNLPLWLCSPLLLEGRGKPLMLGLFATKRKEEDETKD